MEIKLREIVESGKGKTITFEGKKIYINKQVIAKLREASAKEGGIIPLLALLPAILAGLGSAAGIAGGVATAVKNSKESQLADARKELVEVQKQKLITGRGIDESNEGVFQLEGQGLQNGVIDIVEEKNVNGTKIYDGSGIYLNPYEGKGLTELLRAILKKDKNNKEKKPLKKIFKKLGKGQIQITQQGEGIFLEPYKNM